VLVFSTEVKLWSRFNEVRTLWFALSIFCLRIPLDVAQHSEMISPTIPI